MSSNNDEQSEAFIENALLTEVFGLHPQTRVLAAMVTKHDENLAAFTESELRRIGGVDSDELSEALDKLMQIGLITVVDTDTPSKAAYQLNRGNLVAEQLIEFNEAITQNLRQ